jgi:hypothetical protein
VYFDEFDVCTGEKDASEIDDVVMVLAQQSINNKVLPLQQHSLPPIVPYIKDIAHTNNIINQLNFFFDLPSALLNRSKSFAPNDFIGRITNSTNFGSFFSTLPRRASQELKEPPRPHAISLVP